MTKAKKLSQRAQLIKAFSAATNKVKFARGDTQEHAVQALELAEALVSRCRAIIFDPET